LKGDYRHIAVASSADQGRTFSAPLIVSDDQWVIAGCPVSGPALLAEDGGALKVLWYTEGEAGERGLYLTQSLDGGRTFSARQLVSKGAIHGTPLLLRGDALNSVALWQAGESGLMRADILKDGSIQAAVVSELKKASLPSAGFVSGQPLVAYISTLNNQRSIWLVRVGKEEKVAGL
jgi:hypothetical protein